MDAPLHHRFPHPPALHRRIDTEEAEGSGLGVVELVVGVVRVVDVGQAAHQPPIEQADDDRRGGVGGAVRDLADGDVVLLIVRVSGQAEVGQLHDAAGSRQIVAWPRPTHLQRHLRQAPRSFAAEWESGSGRVRASATDVMKLPSPLQRGTTWT